MLAILVTAANVHDTQAAGPLLDRAAAAGWKAERIKVDGVCIGERVARAAAPGIEVQVHTRDPNVKGFKPLPLRRRIEGTFGTLPDRYHRLTRNLEQSPAAAEDAVTVGDCRRLLKVYDRA